MNLELILSLSLNVYRIDSRTESFWSFGEKDINEIVRTRGFPLSLHNFSHFSFLSFNVVVGNACERGRRSPSLLVLLLQSFEPVITPPPISCPFLFLYIQADLVTLSAFFICEFAYTHLSEFNICGPKERDVSTVNNLYIN